MFLGTPDFCSILPIVPDGRNKRSECNLSRYKGQESDDYYYRSNRTRVASSGTRWYLQRPEHSPDHLFGNSPHPRHSGNWISIGHDRDAGEGCSWNRYGDHQWWLSATRPRSRRQSANLGGHLRLYEQARPRCKRTESLRWSVGSSQCAGKTTGFYQRRGR